MRCRLPLPVELLQFKGPRGYAGAVQGLGLQIRHRRNNVCRVLRTCARATSLSSPHVVASGFERPIIGFGKYLGVLLLHISLPMAIGFSKAYLHVAVIAQKCGRKLDHCTESNAPLGSERRLTKTSTTM